MARIAAAGFHHESNSFVAAPAAFMDFARHGDRPGLLRGAAVVATCRGGTFPMSGFLAEMEARHEIVPLIWTGTTPSGPVTREAYERIVAEMLGRLSAELPVDGVYLDLHGAMVSDDYQDGEGELLRRTRAIVGADVPIAVSLDYHANITPDMVAFADTLTAFRTYPHVDQRDTGVRAARALTTMLARGRPTGRALRKLPFIIPVSAQSTMVEPCRGIVDRLPPLETGDILAASFLAGFPPADIFHMGPSVAVSGYGQAAADALADALARDVALLEPRFSEQLHSPDDGVREAMAIAERACRPVILADTQDNPGAGGTSDTTGLLEALVRLGAGDAVLGIFCDREAAEAAHRAGEGATLTLALGGTSGKPGEGPFHHAFRVARLASGRFRNTGPVAGGREVDIGPMALLQAGGVRVAVSSRRMQAHDQAPFRHLGVEPAAQKILALKSSVHFRADFQPIAERVLVVLAPGGNPDDPAMLPYRRLRPGVRLRPLGPEFRM